MFIVRKARKLRVVEQNLCEYQSMNQRAEYTVRGLNKKLSDDLVEMLAGTYDRSYQGTAPVRYTGDNRFG